MDEEKSDLPDRASDRGSSKKDSSPKASDKSLKKRQIRSGAKIHHDYRDRTEPTVGVTHDDLREIRSMGTIHQILFGTGMFFLSGGFWELVRIFSEQQKFAITPWVVAYLIVMIAGGLWAAVGAFLFHLKQQRLDKYFRLVEAEDD